MKPVFTIYLFLFFILQAKPGFSQKEVEISGIKYLIHSVEKSETVFSLCKKYKIGQAELQKANPGLPAVLQVGSTVKIPVGKAEIAEKPKLEPAKPATVEDEFYYHKVAKKQTLPSIAKQYGITANDLVRFNPELTNGLVVGQVLKIPVNITKDATPNSLVTTSDSEQLADYSVHPVVSGETLYSLEQRYGLTHDEMLKYNPALQNGLKAGMKLKIPAKKTVQQAEPAVEPKSFTKYQVERGETLFSLASRFGVEVADLKKANPSLLSRSLEAGETILIPARPEANNVVSSEVQKSVGQQVAIPAESGNCSPVQGGNKQKFKAGLLLPFNIRETETSGNETSKALLTSKIKINAPVIPSANDSTVLINLSNIDPKTAGFLEFYEGVLLATDSLQRSGMNIEWYVFDASNQQAINSLLQMEEFRDLNLIIGPVYPELQETVSTFAAKNRIPMISPLAPNGSFELSNPWFFKVNPTKEYQLDQAIAYSASEFSGKNFIIIQLDGNSNSAEAKLAESCRAKMSGNKQFRQYNFQTGGINGIKPLLDETGENIFMIPSDNEAQVSVAITNLNALAENYNIVLMSTPNLTKMKSLQTENFHRIRLRYLSPYFIDYTRPFVRRFVSQYREVFLADPTPFSHQGYDVGFYFLSALYRFGKDFRPCLPEYPMELTQMDFSFRRVTPMGGFMNNALIVTAYERNFDILKYGTLGMKKTE